MTAAADGGGRIPELAARFGEERLAPLLFGFSAWLAAEVDRLRPDLVLFLSREGAVLRRAAEAGPAPPSSPTAYAYASRQVLRLASAHGPDDLDAIVDAPSADCPLGALLWSRFRLGAGDVDGAALRACGLPGLGAVVNRRREAAAIKGLVRAHADAVLGTAAVLRERAARHYRSLGAAPGARIAVVDVGYNGTAQAAIARLLPDCDVHGRYLATFEGVRRAVPEGSARGWVLDGADNRLRAHALTRNVPVVEFLLMAEEGTLVGFDEDGGGRVAPRLDPPLRSDSLRFVLAAQRAALAAAGRAAADPDPERGGGPLWRILDRPDPATARAFEGLAIDDGFGGLPDRWIVARIPEGRALTEAAEKAAVAASAWKEAARTLAAARRGPLARVARSRPATLLRRLGARLARAARGARPAA